MKKCPSCNNGKIDITSQLYDAKTNRFIPQEPVSITCFWCYGTGVLTDEQEEEQKRFFDRWCKCGNPSGEVIFFNDRHSHGYECADCGKVVQTG